MKSVRFRSFGGLKFWRLRWMVGVVLVFGRCLEIFYLCVYGLVVGGGGEGVVVGVEFWSV